jgi:FtsH-binding integral membrane protein
VRLYQRSADRRPDPPPLATDDRATVLVGIGLWLVALAVALVLHGRLADAGRTWWIWTAVTGVLLGLAGLVYLRRHGRG